jgi:hypothetical protein
MEMLNNSDSTLTQLCKPITLRNPEDGGHMFPETSALTRARCYKVPEDLYQRNESVYCAIP